MPEPKRADPGTGSLHTQNSFCDNPPVCGEVCQCHWGSVCGGACQAGQHHGGCTRQDAAPEPVVAEPVTIDTGPEVSIEPGDLRTVQPTRPITYYQALPIRLAREESGGPVVSMFCTMRHHTECTGFTQFRGELRPCDCLWCHHDSIELEEEVA